MNCVETGGAALRWVNLRLTLCGVLALASVLAVAPASAQQSGGKASDPGQIQKRIVTPETPVAPMREVSPPEPSALPAAKPAGKIVLVGVEITGSTVYQPDQLTFAYEDLLGRKISAVEVEGILEKITAKYRKDGYILSRATAPQQDAEAGILRVEIVEGSVEQVAFTGDTPGNEDLLRGIAENIKAIQPLRLAGLERYLLLMADIPGLKVFPSFSAIDEASGTYRLEIGLKHDGVDGFASLDNRGTTAVGTMQLFAGVNLNSAFGMLEHTRFSVFTVPTAPEELLYGEIFHQQMLNAEGTRVSLSVSRSTVDTGDAGTDGKENSFGTRVRLSLSHPIIRSRKLNFSASLTFDALDSDKNSPVDSNDFDDRLRVLRLGGKLNFSDDLDGANWISAEISKGLRIFNANDRDATQLSRTNGRSDFAKVKLDITRRQKLMQHTSLQLSASAQKSPHILLSSEEFSVGGKQFGRAYNPSDISGGDGAAAMVELQFDSPVKPEALRSIQVYGYYDIGAVWGEDTTHNSMASAGGGVRLGLPFGINADLEFAWPLTRAISPDESGNDGPRIFFNILSRF